MTFRNALFWTHLAAGLAAGGVILSMAISGILMVYEPQVVAWAERDRRTVAVPTGSSRLSLDTLVAKADMASSKGRPNAVTVKSDPSASVTVSFGKDGGNLYLDPYAGTVLGGDSKIHRLLRAVENWHRFLGSRNIGKPITGTAVLFLFFQLLSGLCLWWPRKWTRAGFRSSVVPNLMLKGKARDWNWHNAAGFWAAPLLLVTTLTGTVIAHRWANDLLFVLTGNAPPPRPPEEKSRPEGKRMGAEARKPLPSLEPLMVRAQFQVPQWASINLRLPQKAGGPVSISIIEPGFSRRAARSQLTLNASTAEIIKWEPYADQNLGRRLRSWVVPVHTGRAGGAAGQFLALLSAIAAILMVWTGAAMAWRRFFK